MSQDLVQQLIDSLPGRIAEKHCKIDLLHELSAIGKKAFDIHEIVVLYFSTPQKHLTNTPTNYGATDFVKINALQI